MSLATQCMSHLFSHVAVLFFRHASHPYNFCYLYMRNFLRDILSVSIQFSQFISFLICVIRKFHQLVRRRVRSSLLFDWMCRHVDLAFFYISFFVQFFIFAVFSSHVAAAVSGRHLCRGSSFLFALSFIFLSPSSHCNHIYFVDFTSVLCC